MLTTGLPLDAQREIARLRALEPVDALSAEQAEDLMLVDGFARRPTPEVKVLPLDADRFGSLAATRIAA